MLDSHRFELMYTHKHPHSLTPIISPSGIGLETARDLHRRGARVVLACRNARRAADAAADIAASNADELPDPEATLATAEVDLACPQSVRKCAAKIIEAEERYSNLILEICVD